MGLFSFFNTFFSRNSFPGKIEHLFIGLGNPGDKYAETRHNVGFRVADAFCGSSIWSINGHEAEAEFCAPSDSTICVIKPVTFMNRSGDAVGALLEKYHIPIQSILVIVDDFNIPLGKIRVRPGGSDGGHNGLKSISAQIGTEYARLRVGIGPLPGGVSVIDFVLGKFSESEEERLKEVIPCAVSAMKLFMTDDISAIMNKFNT